MASPFRAGESTARFRMRRDAPLHVDHEGDERGGSPIRRRRIEFNYPFQRSVRTSRALLAQGARRAPRR